MVDFHSAIVFVEQHANPVEKARLRFLLRKEAPDAGVIAGFSAAQRADGGWPPFWAPDISSVDATCFRLAQAEQMGVAMSGQPFLLRSLDFLAARQSPEGYWEEDASLAGSAPPWARPGSEAARLYLTANAGCWLAKAGRHPEHSRRAGELLLGQQGETGLLPSFRQAQWLAAALFDRLGLNEQAGEMAAALLQEVNSLSAGELAWLLVTFHGTRLAGGEQVQAALGRLVRLLQPDGRWASDDGPPFDVHTTLEALYALERYHAADRLEQ